MRTGGEHLTLFQVDEWGGAIAAPRVPTPVDRVVEGAESTEHGPGEVAQHAPENPINEISLQSAGEVKHRQQAAGADDHDPTEFDMLNGDVALAEPPPHQQLDNGSDNYDRGDGEPEGPRRFWT